MDLLQHNSFHESIASSPQLAQKKFLGKAVFASVLQLVSSVRTIELSQKRIQCIVFQIVGQRSSLGILGCCRHDDEAVGVMRGFEERPSARKAFLDAAMRPDPCSDVDRYEGNGAIELGGMPVRRACAWLYVRGGVAMCLRLQRR
jgi:hypothetical protein